MAALYNFGDIVSESVAQVEAVSVDLASPGPGTVYSLTLDALDGRGAIGFRYTTTGLESQATIAAALAAVLLRDQTYYGIAPAGATVIVLGPLGKPFVCATSARMHRTTTQAALLGRIAENMKVLVSREIFTIPVGTLALHPGESPESKTMLRCRGIDTGTVYELDSDEVVTLVTPAASSLA